MTYLKFTEKNVKIKTVNQHLILSGLNILDYYINSNVKKKQLEPTHEITKKSLITHKFCNNDLNKFILLLRKGVFTLINTWIAGKDLTKHHYQIKSILQ